MKKKLALVFLSLAVLCSLAACGGKKEEKGTTEAPTKQLETTVQEKETEKAEEVAEKQDEQDGDSLRVISLKGPTSIGLVNLMDKTEKEGLAYSFFRSLFPERRILRQFLPIWQRFCIRN